MKSLAFLALITLAAPAVRADISDPPANVSADDWATLTPQEKICAQDLQGCYPKKTLKPSDTVEKFVYTRNYVRAAVKIFHGGDPLSMPSRGKLYDAAFVDDEETPKVAQALTKSINALLNTIST
jgi:hypothetical protein